MTIDYNAAKLFAEQIMHSAQSVSQQMQNIFLQ
jgi:hypothetical protein